MKRQLENVYEYIDGNTRDFVETLIRLVRQPSISAKGEGIKECAGLVEKIMQETGLETKLIQPAEGNPLVYGEIKSKESDKTLMFYNHYDVQPPEPIEQWISGPFSGEIREGKIYGRGTSDNKGNLVSRLKAVEAFLKIFGELPVNVKFVVDGEEEIGSPHLKQIIEKHKELFSADAVIWEFGGTNRKGNPCLYLGLKGILSVELQVEGAVRDVHSANAPLVPNPAWRLAWVLNLIKNEREEILIEGFYENVRPPLPEELQYVEKIPFDEEEWKEELGLKEFLLKRSGVEALKALLYQPSCTINGMISGYTGVGSKTIVPKTAMAKLDFRLVPNQTPTEIFRKLVNHLRNSGFKDIKITKYGSTEPVKTSITHKFVKTVVETAEKVYGKQAVIYPLSPGSGPMHLFKQVLRCPIVSVGCSHPKSNTHAPNENLEIKSFIKGTMFIATLLWDFASSS
jgi:acetylornithine deacetylase/succinyl-diaminopimelate desuccinylase-like protein